MEITILSLDFQHNSHFIRRNDFSYLWSSEPNFIADSNFPFVDTTVRVSYEPERNLFVVERLGGVTETGDGLPEIQWAKDNFDSLLSAATSRDHSERFVVTLAMERAQLLFDTDWVLQRKQEQDLLGLPNTMSDEQFNTVLVYRQALRDLTNTYSADTPATEVVWPVKPSI